MSFHIGGPGQPGHPENTGTLWIRDAAGNPIELWDVWIRNNGQLRSVDKIWIRNNSYAYTSTIHYDNVPEPLIAPPTPTYNEQAVAKGHKRWLIVPQAAGDPNNTGTINIPDVLSFISTKLSDPSITNATYGQLDFETPYSTNLRQGVIANLNDPDYIHSRDQLIAVIQAVRNAYPQIKWTHALVPNVKFFIANNTWWGLENNGDYETINNEITKYVNAYGPIMDHQDFLSTLVYDKYVWEESDPNTSDPPSRHDQAKRWTHYSIETCKRHNGTRNQTKLIIPNICPMYQYANVLEDYTPIFIPDDEVREETIHPALENGSKNEFVIWSGHEFWITGCFDTVTYPLVPPSGNAMAHRISMYRIAYVQDHDPFNGGPEDWVDSTGQYQEALRHSVCQRMIEFMDSVQSMTIEKTKDNAPELVYTIS